MALCRSQSIHQYLNLKKSEFCLRLSDFTVLFLWGICCFSDKAVSNQPSGKSIHISASFRVLGNIKSCSISQLVDMIFGNNQFQDEL